MILEQIISQLYTDVKKNQKTHSRHSSRFVGLDMYPQVCTGRSWQSQNVDNEIYYIEGDIWVSSHKYKVITSERKKILTLSKCILVESFLINIPTFKLKLGEFEIDIEDKNEYDKNIQRILYPNEGYEIFTKEEFTIEINFRELL